MIGSMRFRDLLKSELERRRLSNRRYSLRAFARFLGVHHATLSRLLRGGGPVAPRCVRSIGGRLGLAAADVALLAGRENEAAVLAALRRPGFRADSRWLASAAGIPVNDVNIALHALLQQRRLRMLSRERWEETP